MRAVNKSSRFNRVCKISSGVLCAFVIGSVFMQLLWSSKPHCPVVEVTPSRSPDRESIPSWTLRPLQKTKPPPKHLLVNGDRLGYGLDKSVYPRVGPRKSSKTLFMYPYTGLCNTLQSVASAFTVADREKFDIKVVFDPAIFGPASWEDLFEEPKLGTVNSTFPDGEINSQQTKSCKVHEPIFAWNEFQSDWESGPDDSLIRCVSVCCWREPPFPLSAHWFYSSLVPSQMIREAIQTYKESVEWHKYQWIGVHLRRTDNMDVMRDLISYGPLRDLVDHESPTDGDILPLSSYTNKMMSVAQSLPKHDLQNYQEVKPVRFFLATDNSDARDYVVNSFPQGMVTGFKKEDYDSIRTSISGMQTSVVDLFLLATCELLIGTPYSTFSATANYIGRNFYLEPDFAYKSI